MPLAKAPSVAPQVASCDKSLPTEFLQTAGVGAVTQAMGAERQNFSVKSDTHGFL